MSNRIGTDFYSNELDEEGQPIKSTQIARKVQKEIEMVVEEKFVSLCIASGLPRDQEKRIAFFFFFSTVKKYALLIMVILFSALATNFFGGYDLIKRNSDEKHQQ